jgi:hypothetical protein
MYVSQRSWKEKACGKRRRYLLRERRRRRRKWIRIHTFRTWIKMSALSITLR